MLTPDDVRQRFPHTESLDDVASLISLNPKHLRLLLSELPRLYHSFEINKRNGGTRAIHAPNPQLFLVQSRLKLVFDALYEPAPTVHGFVSGRGIVSNAEPHVRAKNVLNVDLVDFFPSIRAGRIAGVLQSSVYGAGLEAATVMASLCCKDDALPIGAPTSPVLSNMVSYHLDKDLLDLARRFSCYYTRYADDITFSNRRWHFPPSLASKRDGVTTLGEELTSVIGRNGFQPNASKTRLQRKSERQEVTGVLVNKRTNVDRRYIRRIRAMLHSWESEGLASAQARFNTQYGGSKWNDLPPKFQDSLGGMIAFVEMVKGADDPVASRLRHRFDELKAGRVASPRDSALRQTFGPNRPLTLLHLSDLHLSDSRSLDANPLLDELRGFLRQQPTPDLILVTGDIAQSGTSSDYSHARDFFEKLLIDLGAAKTQIHFVPGNHDVDRTRISLGSESLHDRLRDTNSQSQLDTELEKALTSTEDEPLLLSKFEGYLSFVQTFAEGEGQAQLSWSREYDHDGVKVVIAGLNTALLSYNDADMYRLALGKFIVRRETAKTGDLNISIFHHPLSELSSADPNSKAIVEQWSDIMLRGHTHESSVGRFLINGDEYCEIAVGSTHQGTTNANGVALHEVDLSGNRLRSTPIEWNVDKQRWYCGAGAEWMTLRSAENPRSKS